ncbi:IDEAL domain-containing protein [Bacillus sp. FJAT-50079]|uniref:IDEAL domain-containing protein n=1 Tax=Bacillus sp. FJAT-50079 TaxID=2833577 RepID=UPI001BC8DA00|nr:IDEAL domain-containing protein [Bacillus sp. FJAT-50079]MBS4210673.1 IDEAL domain-containing protein [Bacillus sp. FJAT-50079]
MERKKSYQELLKEYTMTQMQDDTRSTTMQTEVFLNSLLQKRREEQLRTDIDKALDEKDRDTFLKLSDELNRLLEK